jgi:hypothetical protein
LRVGAISAGEFSARAADTEVGPAIERLPTRYSLQSGIYQFKTDGPPPKAVLLTIPVQAEALDLVDLYGWDGTDWKWLPSRTNPDTAHLTAEMNTLPALVALMKAEPNLPVVTAQLPPETKLPAEVEGALSELLLTGFDLQPDGTIAEAPVLPQINATAARIPRLCNWRTDGTLTADMGNILSNSATRQRHLDAIVGLALSGGYPAIYLDYRGMGPIHRKFFSEFVAELAAALHEQDRKLLVGVESPAQISDSNWDTGAYDWAAIGQAVDRLLLPLPVMPSTPDQQRLFLSWAIGQADRTKIQPIVSLQPFLITDGVTIPSEQAVAMFGPIETSPATGIVSGERVTLTLTGLARGDMAENPETGLLVSSIADGDGPGTRWYMPTNTTLNLQLQQIAQFNLAGVMLADLFDQNPAPQVWAVLHAFRSQTEPSFESAPAWVWTVTANDSLEIVSADTVPLTEIEYQWVAPDTPGNYQVGVGLAVNGGEAALPVANLTLIVQSPSPPTPTPTPTSRPVSSGSGNSVPIKTQTPALTPTPTSTSTPTAAPRPVVAKPRPSQSFMLAYTKWDGYFHNLYIANSDSNQEQLVLTHAAGPSFSSDKKKLFFIGEQGVDQQTRENWVACSFGTISEGVVGMDLMSPVSDICQVQDGAWTCERKQIDVGLGPSDVCAANNIAIYQNLDWKVGSARWTKTAPDDDSVAFDSDLSGGYRMYFRAIDPTSQQFHFEIPGEQGSWAPDGERLVYRSGRNNQSGLWISNKDDSNPIRITDNGTDSFPTWSPDGGKIAFHREFEGDVEIFTVNPDGSGLQRLTNTRGPDTLPVYTPDGRIVFRSGRNDSWSIWIMGGDGSNQTLLVPNAPVSHIDWASDRMDVR